MKGGILQYFQPALSDNWSWKQIFGLFLEWSFYTGLKKYSRYWFVTCVQYNNWLKSTDSNMHDPRWMFAN